MSLSFVQVEAIKKISEYVAQLRMVGKGHGMFCYHYFSYWFTEFAFDVHFHHFGIFLLLVFMFYWLAGVWHFDQSLLHDGHAA